MLSDGIIQFWNAFDEPDAPVSATLSRTAALLRHTGSRLAHALHRRFHR